MQTKNKFEQGNISNKKTRQTKSHSVLLFPFLPDDIEKHIVSFIPKAEYLVLRFVCKEWEKKFACKTHVCATMGHYSRMKNLKCILYVLSLMPKSCHKESYVLLGEIASENGDEKTMRYLLGEGLRWRLTYSTTAAKNGHTNFLKSFRSRISLDAKLIKSAVLAPNTDCLEYLLSCHDPNIPLDAALRKAVCKGKIGAVRLLKGKLQDRMEHFPPAIMCWATKSGKVEMLSYCSQYVPWNGDECEIASKNGFLDCLVFAHKNGVKLTSLVMENAVLHGNLECLRYAHKNGCQWDEKILVIAIKEGQTECLEYALDNGCPISKVASKTAINVGRLEHLKLLVAHGYVLCVSDLRAAIKVPNLDFLDFVLEKQYFSEEEEDWTGYTAERGYLGALKTFVDHGYKCDENTVISALVGDQIECLRYLLSRKIKVDEKACEIAAEKGFLKCLKIVRAFGCPCDETASYAAARAGHLDILKYLRNENIPWDTLTCAYAAENGRLGILKFLHEEGCPWDETTTCSAINRGHIECYKFAVLNGCPTNEENETLANLS
jgi:hypothetical protein